MAALYITSLSENAGKTMLCAGLGKSWQNAGRKVGYFKPLLSQAAGNEKDARFIKRVLALSEDVEALSPALNPQNPVSEVRRTYARVADGKDVVVVDGLPLNNPAGLIEILDAKVLVIHDYAVDLAAAIPEYKKLGNHLSGVVVNKVPKRRIGEIKALVADELKAAKINFLGIIPEDRVLMGLTVAELAETLQGSILNDNEKSDELIENVMLGAMTFDSGPDYFGRKNNKAVILKSERPDMQMAALETSSRCIVLSGGGTPMSVVARQAAAKKVPLISAPGDVPFIVAIIEKAISHVKFNQEKKMPELMGIIRQSLDVNQISNQIGVN